MTVQQQQQAIRWALARHLKGMRETCDLIYSQFDRRTQTLSAGLPKGVVRYGHLERDWRPEAQPKQAPFEVPQRRIPWPECPRCKGSEIQPVPLTAEGLIDVGRLIRAIEAEGGSVSRLGRDKPREWGVDLAQPHRIANDPDLAVAFLKAQGDWPVSKEEESHV